MDKKLIKHRGYMLVMRQCFCGFGLEHMAAITTDTDTNLNSQKASSVYDYKDLLRCIYDLEECKIDSSR